MALEDYRDDCTDCSRCSYCKWIPLDHIKSARFARACPSIEYSSFQAYSLAGRLAIGLSLLEGRIDYNDQLKDIVWKCQMGGACDVSDKICRYNIRGLEVMREMPILRSYGAAMKVFFIPNVLNASFIRCTPTSQSPSPIVPWRDAVGPDLGERRRRESVAAMVLLGVPVANLRVLGLPEAELSRHGDALARGLQERITALQPDCIFVPFRFDRHPDHLAVNQAVTALKQRGQTQARLFEYFVSHRWRLLPRRDVRAYLRPEQVLRLDISAVATRKRAALDCFETQTTRFNEWQTRPILQPALLDEECAAPEQFLLFDPALPGTRVFTGGAAWIRIAHWLEPVLLRWKYRLMSWGLRALDRQA